MLTFINRRDLILTKEQSVINEICNRLNQSGIEYQVEDVGRGGNHIYSLSVKKRDYPEAGFLLHTMKKEEEGK